MDQTPEQDEPIGKDGTIYCIDLAHHDGQELAHTLQQKYEDVASVLRARNSNMHYLLVMVPTGQHSEVSAMLAKPGALLDGLSIMHKRAKGYGDDFEIIIAPSQASHVLELWKRVLADG